MENRFDELAKAVAEGMTRREVLSRLRGVLAGGALAFLGMKAASADNPKCPLGEHQSVCHIFGTIKVEICCPIPLRCELLLGTIPLCTGR
jgi:hypothetical protein